MQLYEVAGGLSGPVKHWGARGPHSCDEADPQRVLLSLSESRCHRSCLKHKQLATVRVACSYRSDTISPGCLRSTQTLANSKPARKAVSF